MSEIWTASDFLECYPQFDNTIPKKLLTTYVDLANKVVRVERWREYTQMGRGLYVAHFATMYLMGNSKATDADTVGAAGAAHGVVSSKSAFGASVSYDLGAVNGDLSGFGTFKLTHYGTQLITIAKIVGKGGMQIW